MKTPKIILEPALPHAYTPTNGRSIKQMVIHSTGGSKAGDLIALTGREKGRGKISIHVYATRAGELYQIVKDKDIAYHAGACNYLGILDWNIHSLGLEFENRNDGKQGYTDAQLEAGIWWCRSKVKLYEIAKPFFVWHEQIAIPRTPKPRRTDPVNFPRKWFFEQVYSEGAFILPTAEELEYGVRRYRVNTDGAALRTKPDRTGDVVLRMQKGDTFTARGITFGEVIGGQNGWLHRADSRGFCHESLLDPI
jgi:N-acetyl-anhydromuramyl-L-alanine amidase AmpD